MAKKGNDIDLKQFMLEKGERAALWTMVGVMAVFIVLGVFVQGMGTSANPKTYIDKLKGKGGGGGASPASQAPDGIAQAGQLGPIDRNLAESRLPWFSPIGSMLDSKWR